MASKNEVDTGAVFKHPIRCPGCNQAFYFTLRKITDAKKLACPQCDLDINLTDETYAIVIIKVRETIALIDLPRPQRTSNLGLAGV